MPFFSRGKSDVERREDALHELVQRWLAGGMQYSEYARQRDLIVADGDNSQRFGPQTQIVQAFCDRLDALDANAWR